MSLACQQCDSLMCLQFIILFIELVKQCLAATVKIGKSKLKMLRFNHGKFVMIFLHT